MVFILDLMKYTHGLYFVHCTGIILRMRPANEIQIYNVMSSLIDQAHKQKIPVCIHHILSLLPTQRHFTRIGVISQLPLWNSAEE